MLRRLTSAVAARAGLRVEPLAPAAWLVQRDNAGEPPLAVDRLGRRGWLLRPRGSGGLRVHRLESRHTGTYLLAAQQAARQHMNTLQRELGQWLLREQLVWTLDALGVNVVLDVGANVGQYARRLRIAGYDGRIVSFEPVAECLEQLCAASADDPLWSVRPHALGETDGAAEIGSTPGKTLSSLLPATDFGRGWSQALQQPVAETIQVRRLESVLDEVLAGVDDPRVFLKLDTQGYDLAVLRGTGPRLKEIVGLQSEVACLPLYEGMPSLEEHLAELRHAGFDIAAMFPVSRHGTTLRVIEFDVLLVRADEVAKEDRR